MKRHVLALVGVCCLIPLILVLYTFPKNTNENILKVNIDGIEKVINIQGKSFEQICEGSSGFWMDASMGMTEIRDGVSINLNKCSGCMPNNKNMFCNQDDYVNYIKINGMGTSDFNMRSMNKSMNMK